MQTHLDTLVNQTIAQFTSKIKEARFKNLVAGYFSVELACLLFLTGQFLEVEFFRACFFVEDTVGA